MILYEVAAPLFPGCLLREPEAEPLVEQIRVLLDAAEREQTVLPDWLQTAFSLWLGSTKQWLDDPANLADHERLREIRDRLRSYRTVIGYFAGRET